MTAEEAIKNLSLAKQVEDMLGEFGGGVKNSYLSRSLAMAIDALQKQPCDDCISRQDAINANPSSFSHDHENDLISRQDAIDAVRQAYESDEMFDGYEYRLQELPSAQPEVAKDINVPSNDCISRQTAIEALYHVDEYNGRSVEAIRNLPSAEPKIGKWILSGGYWRCSGCKEKALLKLDKAKGNCKEYAPVRSIFCPNCGTKMEEVKE
jgi:hypothetical protein